MFTAIVFLITIVFIILMVRDVRGGEKNESLRRYLNKYKRYN